jgi:hypothetical protein
MYIIPKQLKEEYKIFDKPKIYWKDVVTCCILLGIFLLGQNFVHAWLVIPYWLVAALISYFLIQPAKRSNPKKRNWEALILFVGKDRETFYSINHVQEENNDDE